MTVLLVEGVGRSGKTGDCLALEMPRARRRPCLASGIMTGAPEKPIWSWPANRSDTNGAVPYARRSPCRASKMTAWPILRTADGVFMG